LLERTANEKTKKNGNFVGVGDSCCCCCVVVVVARTRDVMDINSLRKEGHVGQNEIGE